MTNPTDSVPSDIRMARAYERDVIRRRIAEVLSSACTDETIATILNDLVSADDDKSPAAAQLTREHAIEVNKLWERLQTLCPKAVAIATGEDTD